MTEFDDVIRLLRENRPEATELELDQIKQRVRRKATQPSRRKQTMKSRLAILAMLVFGMLLSTTGAGIAIQSVSTGNDASVAQYEEPDEDPGAVLGGESGTGNGGSDETLQTTRQVEAGSDGGELPFTGFVAIPVLIGGVALLSAGMVLRRRTND